MTAINHQTYARLRDDVVVVNLIFSNPSLLVRNVDGKVEVALRPGVETNPLNLKQYSYMALMRDQVRVGDVVVVTAGDRGEIKVGQVLEVVPISQVSAARKLKWILGRVDAERVTGILEQENQLQTVLQAAQARQQQVDTLRKLKDEYGEEAVSALSGMDGMGTVVRLLSNEAPAAPAG